LQALAGCHPCRPDRGPHGAGAGPPLRSLPRHQIRTGRRARHSGRRPVRKRGSLGPLARPHAQGRQAAPPRASRARNFPGQSSATTSPIPNRSTRSPAIARWRCSGAGMKACCRLTLELGDPTPLGPGSAAKAAERRRPAAFATKGRPADRWLRETARWAWKVKLLSASGDRD
jgi:hypothetical protein